MPDPRDSQCVQMPRSCPGGGWAQLELTGALQMYFLLTEEEINGDALIRLVKKNDEDEIFVKLGLQTFGKRVKFRKLVEGLLPCHEKISRPRRQLVQSHQ